jgi:hypothetical protein
MKKNPLKALAVVFALLFFVSLFSSCNRGVGCPTFNVDVPSLSILGN